MDEDLRRLERQAQTDPKALVRLIDYKIETGIPISMGQEGSAHHLINDEVKRLKKQKALISMNVLSSAGTILQARIMHLLSLYPSGISPNIYMQYYYNGHIAGWYQVLRSEQRRILHEDGSQDLSAIIHIDHDFEEAPYCLGCQSVFGFSECQYDGPHLILGTRQSLFEEELTAINQYPSIQKLYQETTKFMDDLRESSISLALSHLIYKHTFPRSAKNFETNLYLTEKFVRFEDGSKRYDFPYEALNFGPEDLKEIHR